MTSTEPLDLDAIEARANAATEGPWRVADHGGHGEHSAVIEDIERWRGMTNNVYFGQDFPTASFVAHAREDVPALIARVRTAEANARRYRDQAVAAEEETRSWRRQVLAARAVETAEGSTFRHCRHCLFDEQKAGGCSRGEEHDSACRFGCNAVPPTPEEQS